MKSSVRLSSYAAVISMMLLASGCWSASDVQDTSYAKALGVDYVDGQFHIYAQFLDFTSIAKSDSSGRGGSEPGIWIGHGRGSSLNNATDDLYRTSQFQIRWGHISSLLISERANIAKGIEIIDMLNRYPEIRYNTWLYITHGNLEDILAANSFYGQTSLSTIMHDPKPNYMQYSFLPAIELFKYIANYNEPDITSYVPVMGINQTQWERNGEPLPLPTLTGAFFESSQGVKVFLSRQKLKGFEWMQEEMIRAPLAVEKDGVHYANLSMGKPKIKIKPIQKGDDVVFHVEIKLLGAMYEYIEPLPYEQLTGIAETIVAQQIKDVYQEGVDKGIDIYNLEKTVRHKNPQLWKRLTNNGTKLLVHENSIEKLEVSIIIVYNGKYKRQTSPS